MEEKVEVIKYSEVELQQVQWLWGPYIPFGKLTIIQGDPGEGKTTLALRLAAACSTGTPLLGMEPMEPFNVIYQSAEDGMGDTIKPRLMEAGADLDRVLSIVEDKKQLRMASDELCMQYGLSVVKPKQKRTPGMSAAEYRSADKGESWKLRLAIAIDDAMIVARSRAHFIELMEMEGYLVRWDKDRKYITYTTPEGKRCRDIRLHEEKYLKENMEREFRIRKGHRPH